MSSDHSLPSPAPELSTGHSTASSTVPDHGKIISPPKKWSPSARDRRVEVWVNSRELDHKLMLIRRRRRFEQYRRDQQERQNRVQSVNVRGGRDTEAQSDGHNSEADPNDFDPSAAKQEPAQITMEKGSIIAVKEEPAEPMLSGDRDDDLDRVAKLQNSIVNHDAKIKKDSQFDFQTVYDRLKLVGTELYPIDLDEDTKYFGVTRKFISRVYGGGMIPTFPNINPELLRMHGIDNFAFPSLDYNPHAPVVPGAPGLFMILGGTASDYGTHGEWGSEWYRVFVSYKKDAFWTYMGNYRFLLAPFLSVSEFAMQSALVKRTWARNIRVREWGQGAVARIILRRELGREPTKDEIEGQFEEEERTIKENRQRQKNKQNEGASGMMQSMRDRITDDDVIEALLSGKEVIGVYCMKCIGYDVEFQQFLKRTFIRSQRNALMGRNSGQGIETTGAEAPDDIAPTTKAKTTRKKRKLAERVAESSDAPTNVFGNGGELDDVGGEGTLTEGELVYRPRGTRSRPGSSKAKAIEVD